MTWSDDQRIEIRTGDGLYTFHHLPGAVLMFHHIFRTDTQGTENAWQQWLTSLLTQRS
ncbi:hypothetical protein ACIREM_28035 [Streptomyces shenzhenensis]|uniref:hypothetical protein n=1 Tax=Streptomyces shenzhenensis TaxID=943815 RepID=UPI0037FDDED4